jgi:hypothetical protein
MMTFMARPLRTGSGTVDDALLPEDMYLAITRGHDDASSIMSHDHVLDPVGPLESLELVS